MSHDLQDLSEYTKIYEGIIKITQTFTKTLYFKDCNIEETKFWLKFQFQAGCTRLRPAGIDR